MHDISLNSTQSVKCSDGRTRTGRVVYIHPDRIFCVLQFEHYREAFPMARKLIYSDKAKHSGSRPWTPEEDELLRTDISEKVLAEKFGRTIAAVHNRRYYARRAM